MTVFRIRNVAAEGVGGRPTSRSPGWPRFTPTSRQWRKRTSRSGETLARRWRLDRAPSCLLAPLRARRDHAASGVGPGARHHRGQGSGRPERLRQAAGDRRHPRAGPGALAREGSQAARREPATASRVASWRASRTGSDRWAATPREQRSSAPTTGCARTSASSWAWLAPRSTATACSASASRSPRIIRLYPPRAPRDRLRPVSRR